MKYNVAYTLPNGYENLYQMKWTDRETAVRSLAAFLTKYGTGIGSDDERRYPNGMGTYDFRNAHIVSRP